VAQRKSRGGAGRLAGLLDELLQAGDDCTPEADDEQITEEGDAA